MPSGRAVLNPATTSATVVSSSRHGNNTATLRTDPVSMVDLTTLEGVDLVHAAVDKDSIPEVLETLAGFPDTSV